MTLCSILNYQSDVTTKGMFKIYNLQFWVGIKLDLALRENLRSYSQISEQDKE